MQLDTITARAMQRDKNGLSEELRQINIKDTDDPNHHLTQIPEYFVHFDARKPAAQYVDDMLKTILMECFLYRETIEKDMTRNELRAFDKTLSRYLKHENLIHKLDYEIARDLNSLVEGAAAVDLAKSRVKDQEAQDSKWHLAETQRDFDKTMKDMDAVYKRIAYTTVLGEQQQ